MMKSTEHSGPIAMRSQDSVTVIAPAFNEENHLEAAVRDVIQAAASSFGNYEIIIFDDASSDATGTIADRLAAGNNHIRAVHNPVNHGLGWNFRTGIGMAAMRYVTLVNGKHDIEADELKNIFTRRGEADLIIPYYTNTADRSVWRQSLSRSFTRLLNVVFRLNLHYYNHAVLYRTEFIRRLNLRTNSHAFHAEAVIKSIRSGRSYVEAPVVSRFRPGGKSQALRLRNIAGVLAFLFTTWYDVYVQKSIPGTICESEQ